MLCVHFCYSKLTLRENFAYFSLLPEVFICFIFCNIGTNNVTSVKVAYLKKRIVLGNSSSIFYPSWKMCTLIEIPFPCNLLGIWSLNCLCCTVEIAVFYYRLSLEKWTLNFTVYIIRKAGIFLNFRAVYNIRLLSLHVKLFCSTNEVMFVIFQEVICSSVLKWMSRSPPCGLFYNKMWKDILEGTFPRLSFSIKMTCPTIYSILIV